MVRRPSRRAYVGQWIFLLAVIAVGGLLINTLGANLARRNMTFGFGFLANKAGFDIPFHLLEWSTFDTYAKAGVPMMPVVSGAASTRRQILIYSLLLAPLCLTPAFTGLGGPIYLAVAGAGGAVFVGLAIRLALSRAGRG